MGQKTLIIGRDGVLNERLTRPASGPEACKLLDGSVAAVAELHQAGYRIVVYNREPGLSRRIEGLHGIHEKIRRQVAEAGGEIEAFFWTSGRNALLGLFEQIADRCHLRLGQSSVITDQAEGVRAAMQCGAKALLVRSGDGQETLTRLSGGEGITIYSNIVAAAAALNEQR